MRSGDKKFIDSIQVLILFMNVNKNKKIYFFNIF